MKRRRDYTEMSDDYDFCREFVELNDKYNAFASETKYQHFEAAEDISRIILANPVEDLMLEKVLATKNGYTYRPYICTFFVKCSRSDLLGKFFKCLPDTSGGFLKKMYNMFNKDTIYWLLKHDFYFDAVINAVGENRTLYHPVLLDILQNHQDEDEYQHIHDRLKICKRKGKETIRKI